MLNFLSILSSILFLIATFRDTLGATVPIPDKDPFYQPPAGFESSSPGTVFKNRTSSSGLKNVSAIQLLYRTTDALGNPTATVTTVLRGASSSVEKLVAFQMYEDAANTICAPSYLYNTNQAGNLFGPNFGHALTDGLANGWTLVVSDYEGINSSFTVGHMAGQAVLDGLRAALSYSPLGISPDAVLGGYGYSGGALATGEYCHLF